MLSDIAKVFLRFHFTPTCHEDTQVFNEICKDADHLPHYVKRIVDTWREDHSEAPVLRNIEDNLQEASNYVGLILGLKG